MDNIKVGFTIGKFAPFHRGHEFLINQALKDMDDFFVVVYDTPNLNLKMEDKINAIKRRFPDIKILKAYDSPKKYGLDKDSVKIQMDYLLKVLDDNKNKEGFSNIGKINYFYSSELYGKKVADFMNIKNVDVDIERKIIPISATKIRNNYEEYKQFIV